MQPAPAFGWIGWQALGGNCRGMPGYLEARELPPPQSRQGRGGRQPVFARLSLTFRHHAWLLVMLSTALFAGAAAVCICSGSGERGRCFTTLAQQFASLQPLSLLLGEALRLPALLPGQVQPCSQKQIGEWPGSRLSSSLPSWPGQWTGEGVSHPGLATGGHGCRWACLDMSFCPTLGAINTKANPGCSSDASHPKHTQAHST